MEGKEEEYLKILKAFEIDLKSESTDKSKQEEDLLYKEKLREDNVKDHKHKITVASLWVLFGFAVIIIFVRFYHYVVPETSYWLSNTRLDYMDNTLFSGAAGTILGKFGNKLFNGNS